MREKLAQVFESDDEDEPMDVVVRRFWTRTAAPSPTKTVVREHAKSVVREHAKIVVREHAKTVVREHADIVVREHAKIVDLASARRARARGEPLPF